MFIKFEGNPCGKTTGDCVIRAISIAENTTWQKFSWKEMRYLE